MRYPLEGRSVVLLKLVDLARTPGARGSAGAAEDALVPRRRAPAWAEAAAASPRPEPPPVRVRDIEGPEVVPETVTTPVTDAAAEQEDA